MILYTADWHIKLGQKNVPKEWARKRYHMFFEQVNAIQCDTHIIGGDLFDRIPTMEELEIYWDFVYSAKVPTIIYDGNHEATQKGKTFLSFLKKATSKVNSLVRIVDEVELIDNYNILPYRYLKDNKAWKKLDETLPVFTHVRGEIPPHVKPEIDLEKFADFPIVFAGDLHSHSNCQRNIVYPGSPVTTSFHRSEVETGYILIDEDWSWTWHAFDLPQLLRKTVSSEKEIIPSEYHHTIYELEGDLQSLSTVENSDILDKKVVKRSTEATLILDPEMEITDELSEYLLYILELSEEQTEDIIATYHDYIR